jgi:hypothetical protein
MARDVFVGRIRFLAAGVAADDGFDAGDDFISGFGAPEASAPEDERGEFGFSGGGHRGKRGKQRGDEG